MLLPRSPGLTLGLGAFVIFTLANVGDTKIYDRCELARELHDRFKFSKRDLDKWLCLAYWESRFDTRAYHKGRFDGSGDHGIFQINDKYWCQPYTGYSENVCKVPCYMLRDDNLEDDVQCVNKIFRRHGFHAWMMFTHKCSGNTLEFFNGCDIKSRKGPLPRYEAQASTVSRAYVRPNRTAAEEMEPSASSHERYQASEESIHNVGGDFSVPASTSAASPPAASSLGYGSTAIGQSASTLYRQASLPQTAGQSYLGNPSVLGGASINGQNLFLAGPQGLAASSFASPLTSSLTSPHLSLASPLSFSSPELSLLSSSQLLTPQASQLTPLIHPQAAVGAVPTAGKAKPGMIQRLQGALRPPFRVRPVLSFKGLGRSGRQVADGTPKTPTTPLTSLYGSAYRGPYMQMVPNMAVPFRTSARSVVPAASAPGPVSLMPAPLISGYGTPILLPLNHLTSRGLPPGAGVNKRHGAGVTRKPQPAASAATQRPVDPLIAALNAPFPSSGSKKRKPATSQSSGSDEEEEEDDKKKKKKK